MLPVAMIRSVRRPKLTENGLPDGCQALPVGQPVRLVDQIIMPANNDPKTRK